MKHRSKGHEDELLELRTSIENYGLIDPLHVDRYGNLLSNQAGMDVIAELRKKGRGIHYPVIIHPVMSDSERETLKLEIARQRRLLSEYDEPIE